MQAENSEMLLHVPPAQPIFLDHINSEHVTGVIDLDAFIAKEAADYVLLASMGTTMNLEKAPRLEPI